LVVKIAALTFALRFQKVALVRRSCGTKNGEIEKKNLVRKLESSTFALPNQKRETKATS